MLKIKWKFCLCHLCTITNCKTFSPPLVRENTQQLWALMQTLFTSTQPGHPSVDRRNEYIAYRLRDKGLVWLIGAWYVCMLHRGYNCIICSWLMAISCQFLSRLQSACWSWVWLVTKYPCAWRHYTSSQSHGLFDNTRHTLDFVTCSWSFHHVSLLVWWWWWWWSLPFTFVRLQNILKKTKLLDTNGLVN